MSITVERSWPGGPLRQFSLQRFSGCPAYNGRYAGGYICDGCSRVTCEPLTGVRRISVRKGVANKAVTKWLCAFCEKD